ncbi:DUF1840 domain-containing protein [Thaumasiovibrio subtropicus]|uniref:DUF1840 domain-containing protein n=1 Tax=Thaumasiovibrio subtropicus TaxID=1891207 RepID=UPI000B34FFFA|nr:DUF1840 domain-containing protein [Thaumasiovibrio subtropicus]
MITFKTKHYANIMMFDGVAIQLLAMMGRPDKVPGALLKEEVEEALRLLQTSLGQLPEPTKSQPMDDDEEVSEPEIDLRQRALPLIELLTSARNNDSGVMWE